MVEAFREGLSRYTPTFKGADLEEEQECPAISSRNLSRLLETGRRVQTMLVNTQRQVLVVFHTGETYLATGFTVGKKGDEVATFAKFAAKAGYGDATELFETYANIPESWLGELPSPDHEPNLFQVEFPDDL